MTKKKILFVTPGMKKSGAEKILTFLVLSLKKQGHVVSVVTFSDGYYGSFLRSSGIAVKVLPVGSLNTFFSDISRLSKFIKFYKPDIVQTWMYRGDLFGGLAAFLAGFRNIYWGVRHGAPSYRYEKFFSLLLILLCGILSWVIPRKIICCAATGAQKHRAFGYDISKFHHIPNFCDSKDFGAIQKNQLNFREIAGFTDASFVIGVIARYHSQKGHKLMLRAASILKDRGLKFNVLFVGDGIETEYAASLKAYIVQNDLEGCVSMLPAVESIERVYHSLNLTCMCSIYGEGFPNVIVESFCCGVPVLTTKTGDAGLVASSEYWHIDPITPLNLANKIQCIIQSDKCDLSRRVMKSKRELESKYSKTRFLELFTEVYEIG